MDLSQEFKKMSDELQELRTRVGRLEAKEACLSILNEYLHYLDGGFTEELLELFTPEARVEVMNYPPGSGVNLDYRGRDEIRPVFETHYGIMSRHHAANITLDVKPDGKTADMSCYFMTGINFGIAGGLYEATLELFEGKWLFSYLRIASNWAWLIPQEYPPILSDSLGAGALRQGKPVQYKLPDSKD